MVNIYGELIRAQIERLTPDPAQGMQGRIWLNTTSLRVKIDNGTVIIPLLANDQNIVIGTNGTAANNLRFNRAGTATLELLIGSDATPEGTSTPANWAKLNTKLGGSIIDNYLDYTEIATPANPAASNHRLYFKSDGNLYKLNNAGSEVQVDAANSPIPAYTLKGNNTASSAVAANLTAPQTRAVTNFNPTRQVFTSGSGTYNLTYQFVTASANATVGATYTNNGVTYTVSSTIAGATLLVMTGASTPATSGTLTKTAGTGDSTITFFYFVSPLWLRVRLVGGGGGGTATAGTSGSAGGTTTFGSSFLTASAGSGASGSAPGAGGTATGGDLNFTGGGGGGGGGSGNSSLGIYGGIGGTSFFGGAGVGGTNAPGVGGSAGTSSGSGGGGAGGSSTSQASGGGGAGGYCEKVISAPSLTYAYVVGALGAGGTGGTAGGAGAAGLIMVEEFYQ